MTVGVAFARETTAMGHRISPEYRDGPAFRRYMLFLALAALSIAGLWGALINVIIPLHVQQIEFAHHFRGADAAIDLQQLIGLKAQIASGRVAPTAEQQRLLSLLARFDSARAANLSMILSIGVFMTMLVQACA
ncbi:hypothetical protein [Sphingomonas mollis]|uniref:Uncharacterized protein n=1 Tax=Sphingomonas mollis TaxID=2795726 RepID=A0ABS0XUM2_9SPHN|nr:hypothetical protein [Sphingomonas sp. BT553]MBJ6123748.1 hypothetical protein [Sphingomonas sp. BT553]